MADQETFREGAKAVQETAKASGKAIDWVQGFSNWLSETVGEAIKQSIGFHFTDKLAYRRMEQAIFNEARLADLARKVGDIHNGEAIRPRAIPPKVSIPLLEAATMEFDEDLHSLWAELLASAMNADDPPVEKQFVSILSELSASDAKALKGYWEQWVIHKNDQPFHDDLLVYGPCFDAESGDESSVATLFGLGLVAPSYTEFSAYRPGGNNRYGDFDETFQTVRTPGSLEQLVFTRLGEAFCLAIGLKAMPVSVK